MDMDINNAPDLVRQIGSLFALLQKCEKSKPVVEGGELKPAQKVGMYVALRDAKKMLKKSVDDMVGRLIDAQMNRLEDEMREFIGQNDLKGITSDAGTAYLYKATSVTTADAAAFRRHVIGTEDWDIADWKPNKTRVNELIEAGESVPPGVNYSAIMKVGVRRPGEKE